jgi:DNA-binding LacI/PurR family transcriptional regulator
MATIIDVARAAGVAPSTVSYVLNGKRPISAETRQLVEQCIRQLGYRPPARRTAAARERTNVLGLLAPPHVGANMSAVARFVASTMVAARAKDYDLLLFTDDAGGPGLRRAMSTAVSDAVIVLDAHASDAVIPALMTLDRPVVLVGTPTRPTGLTCVDVDFGPAADRTVEHLANLGHRAIGVLGSPPATYALGPGYPRRFTRAFEVAAPGRGLKVRWRACGDSDGAVQSCVDAQFAAEPDITALVVENETTLPTVIEHLRRLGRRVPEDVSVAAVCHDDVADRPPVRISSVTLPTAELGELAVGTALQEPDPQPRLLTPSLVVRESTGPAPVT